MKNTRVSMVMDCRKAIFEAPSRGARSPSGAQPRALAGRLEKMRPKAGGISHVGREARPTAPEGGRAPRDHMVPQGNLIDKSQKAIGLCSHRWFSTEPTKRILSLLSLLVIALGLPASGQGVRTMMTSEHPSGGVYVQIQLDNNRFQGVRISESEFTKYVAGLKTLEIESATQDQTASLIGQPHEKSKGVRTSVWTYNFIVENDEDFNLRNDLIQKDTELYYKNEESLKRKPFNQREFEAVANERKSLHAKIEELNYVHFYQVTIQIEFLIDGRISSISVEKITQSGSEIVYSQTSEENSATLPEAKTGSAAFRLALLEQHPTDPAPGEMYLNTSDGHFYGWNGKEWRQLDNASGGRFLK